MATCVVIVGAGVAGLTAALCLSRQGVAVHVVEARDRAGGRIWTVRDASAGIPIELGAEFVHGKPPQIWRHHQPGILDIDEGLGKSWCSEQDGLRPFDLFEQVERVMGRMEEHRGADVSFAKFLDEIEGLDERIRRRTLNYVTGFHGADPRDASIQSLAIDTTAGEQIEGDRSFRIRQGYGTLIESLRDQCERGGVTFYFKHVATRVDWSGPGVRIEATHLGGRAELEAAMAVVTLPIGILRLRSGETGHVEFSPPLRDKSAALGKLAAGNVLRISLVFDEAFWRDGKTMGRDDLEDLQFLFSDDPWFPTWWTQSPRRLPLLTGWSPALRSEQFAGQSLEFIRDKALQSLSRVLRVRVTLLEERLVAAYSHDWITDPFSRGAYSYAQVGGAQCFRELALPLEGRLYFAGEATDFNGHHATVHGAIASGERVAKEIIRDLGSTGKFRRSA